MSLASSIVSSLLVVAAGASVAFQQVLNANLRTQLDSPWWASFVSYVVGMVVMLAVALLLPGPRLSLSALETTSNSWVAWTGGLFGAVFVTTALFMVPRLGSATVLALIVVGQMVGSLAFDHFGVMGLQQHPASLVRWAGAALLIFGVVLIRA